jgi:hypothetical protein
MLAMADRESTRQFAEVDDAYLGGKAGRGAENKCRLWRPCRRRGTVIRN